MSSKTVSVPMKDRTLKESSVTNIIKSGSLSKSQEIGNASATKPAEGSSAVKAKKMSIMGFGTKVSVTPSKSRASTLAPTPDVLSASKAPIASKIGPGWNTSTKSEGFLNLVSPKVSYKAPMPRPKSAKLEPVNSKAEAEPNENNFLSTVELTPPSSPVIAATPSMECFDISHDENDENQSVEENVAPVVTPMKTPRRGSTFEEKLKQIQEIEETWVDVPSPMPTDGASKSSVTVAATLKPFDYQPSDDEEESDDELLPDADQEDSVSEEPATAADMSVDDVTVSEQPFAAAAPSSDHTITIGSTNASYPNSALKTPVKSPVKARRPTVKPTASTPSTAPAVPKHMKAPTPHFKTKKAGTPSKDGSALTSSSTASLSATPHGMFKTGMTLGEEIAAQERSLRIYNNESNKASTGVKPKRKLHGGGGNVLSKVESLSPVFSRAGRGDHDGFGRPSIGTMTSQWEFMRTNFLNNSEEDLEWLMVSKKGGAYKYAHKKNCASEDKYFKSMHDIAKYEEKLQLCSGGGAKLPQGIAEIAEKCKGLGNSNDAKLLERLTQIHESLVTYCAATPAAVAAFSSKVEAAIQSFLAEPDKQKVYRKARDLNDRVAAEVKQMQASLVQSRKDQDEALVNMEKWAKRERETDDYASEMRLEEEAWMQKELEPNQAALRLMRQFIPVNIGEISVNELMSMAKDEGGLLSLELATEIKNNRLLHWLVMHPDDIAVSNFLSGDKKAYFENLEAYDVIELRALAVCIPARFELDNDGKKAEWRGRLITRVKQLVAQFNGDKVKGMWDEVLHRRQMVELPPLKPEQQRRLVYYYRTKEQSDVRLKQYDDKAALLAKKEAMLAQAETEAADAKREYDVVLKEMRDPDFLEEYGAEKLAEVKDLAKREYTSADKKVKTLTQDVNRLRKTIAEAPITRDQFYNMDKELERHLKFKMDYNWSEKGQSAVLIEGCFDPEPEIVKKERQAAKCISAEQEAAQRKAELNSLKPTAATTAGTPVDDIVSRVATPVEAVNRFTAIDNAGAADSTAGGSSGVVFASPKPMKRNSVINANPELANALNKMFTAAAASTGATPAKSFRRMSTMANTPAKEGAVNGDASTASAATASVVKEKKVSQSKLLKKLIAPKEEEAIPRRPPMFGPPGAGGMSFLDELKAKKAAVEGGAGAAPSSSGAAPMSFLEELKAKKAAAASSSEGGAPKSFLDQIRGFGKKSETSEASVASANDESASAAAAAPVAVPPKKNLMGGMPNLGFLDMIKARRID